MENCLFLHACPGVGNRTVERKLQIPRGVPEGGEGMVTARIEPYANPPKVYYLEVKLTLHCQPKGGSC